MLLKASLNSPHSTFDIRHSNRVSVHRPVADNRGKGAVKVDVDKNAWAIGAVRPEGIADANDGKTVKASRHGAERASGAQHWASLYEARRQNLPLLRNGANLLTIVGEV